MRGLPQVVGEAPEKVQLNVHRRRIGQRPGRVQAVVVALVLQLLVPMLWASDMSSSAAAVLPMVSGPSTAGQ